MNDGQGLRLSRNVFGPAGQQYASPGHYPGTVEKPAFSGLKWRHDSGFVPSLQGFHCNFIFLPVAMPRADMCMARWGETQIAQHLKLTILFDA
jgi:hypothetical protein